jgi:hypothetical protein
MGFAWTWQLCFAKLSLAGVLYRLTRDSRHSKAWTRTLLTVSVTVLVTAVIVTGLQLSICVPLSEWWNLGEPDSVRKRHCRASSLTKKFIIGFSGLYPG